ncbi:MAG: ATP-binding cassette domain-containing protein, partial [Acidimicrobiia bacterium]|nr:ATP-binding cassette domain-containing protein [Acidimicrobiia bacterium]
LVSSTPRPGRGPLFFDLDFGVSPGDHAAIVGPNGVGKSSILRILSGELAPDEGDVSVGGTVLAMTQDVGMSQPTATLREMLLDVALPELRTAGRALIAADRPWPTAATTGCATPRPSPSGAISAATSSRPSGRPRSSAASRAGSTT